jgi:tetratricopeptide (TPR) repeat protein
MNEETQIAEIEQEKPIKDLYEFEINRFEELYEKDPNYAFQRYGCTLFYSLDPDKIFNMMQKYEWQTQEPLDFYNLGASLCVEENFDEAMQNFQKAESMGCDRPELYYNMALIHEDKEDKDKAKEYFQKYIDASEQWDDIPKSLQLELDEVRDHIKEALSPNSPFYDPSNDLSNDSSDNFETQEETQEIPTDNPEII